MSLRLSVAGTTALAGILTTVAVASPALASPSAQRTPAPTSHTIAVGSNPSDLAISQSLGKAFVVNDGSVSVVSLLTHRQLDEFKGKVTKTINVRRFGPVTAIAFSPGHKRAWVAGPGGVSVVKVSNGKVVKSLPILKIFTSPAPSMGGLVLSGSGRFAYVENSTLPDAPHRGQITAIDTKTYRVAWRVTTGSESVSLAVDTARNVVYAPNYNDDTVTYFSTGKR